MRQLFVNILYILYIAGGSVICQRAVDDTSKWVIHDDALAKEDGHSAPNTTLQSHPIIINLTNYNAIRPAHHIKPQDPDDAEEVEQKYILNFTDAEDGQVLVSDITQTPENLTEDQQIQYADINQEIFYGQQNDVVDEDEYEQRQQEEYYAQAQEEGDVVMYACGDPLNFDFVPGVPRSYIFNELAKEEMLALGDYISLAFGIWWQGNDESIDREGLDALHNMSMLTNMQLYPPFKDEAIAYLDGETDIPPPRFAKAVVVRGFERDVMEYKIGPLPLVDGSIIWEELTAAGQIPYVKRPQSGIGTAWAQYSIGKTAFYLRDIFKDITGGKCYGLSYWAQDDENLEEMQQLSDAECGEEEQWKIDWLSYPVCPASVNDTAVERITRVHWYFFPAGKDHKWSHGDEGELHPIPLSFSINETDVDYKKWQTYDFEYCGQYYKNKEALLNAFNNNASDIIYKCGAPEWGSDDYDWNWSSTYKNDIFKQREPRVASDIATGPHSYEPQGHRYLIVGNDTAEGRRFAWMGWEGHFTMRPDTGLAFYDIRYNKERIAYELSLQDQYVAYSGFTGAGQVVYFDSNFGMGMTTNALKHGLDCPESAIYFTQTKLYSNGAVWADVDVICMFEADMAETEWRHTHAAAQELVGIRRTELVIRSISTIGNYDYIYDIRFKLDASIDVQIHMAGYMEALFFDTQFHTVRDMPFGTRVGKHTLANIHDHLSGWKVDLDVAGRNNSFEKQTVKYGTYKEAFAKHPDLKDEAPPAWFDQLSLKYIDMEQEKKEIGLRIHSDQPAVWHFVNEEITNKWGQPKGYAIVPQDTHMQLMQPGHPFLEAASWTKYHLAVTKYKDYEYVSHASVYDTYMPQKPVRSLDQYLDGEDIVNTDLVGWVMVGVVHVPRTEDVPLISNLGIGYSIKPWNYFDELVSMSVYEQTNFSMECVPLAGDYFDYIWAMD
eukprot:TRINITY_DN11717_c1_g1_i1.p1 TRINITY_DN11717_c1_g1~~TRINITY_DN11717_c1_g1_i1.p1  ORF type:complete len:947 (-),score=198.93 TRINITY_DN11717_c1_g1_i1:162-3002(-)